MIDGDVCGPLEMHRAVGTSRPLVSVILPTYNRAGTIEAAIRSVLTQSVSDIELIVVDDASRDDVGAVVAAIGDARVRTIRHPRNRGAAAARNTGLAAATGEYIAFQDSDDVWLPGKLERQLELMRGLPGDVGAIAGAKVLIRRSGGVGSAGPRVTCEPNPRSRLAFDGDQLGHLLGENRVSVQTGLFRSDCMAGRSWFDPCARANEDWDFAVRLSRVTRIYEDPEPVVLAFVSSDSISTSWRKQSIGLVRVLKKNKDALERRRKQRSDLLLDLSRTMMIAGRRRMATRFLAAALRDRPANAWPVLRAALRRLAR